MSFEIDNVPVWKPAKKVQRRKRSSYPLKLTVDAVVFPGSVKLIGEHNDCTVRALALAAEIPYDVAHEMLAVHCGRKLGKGAVFMNLFADAAKGRIVGNYFVKWLSLDVNWDTSKYLRCEAVRVRKSGTTVRQLIDSGKLPARCVLSINRHVMACINGVVHDTFNAGARSIVNGYYSFEKVWQ